MTRQGLNNKFRKYPERSIHEEIIRVKMNYVILLLINTNVTISHLSHSVGYKERKNLCRVFRKITGMSLKEYRNQYCNISGIQK